MTVRRIFRWDDSQIRVPSDDERTARYRLLQSRWRETVLLLSHGVSVHGNPVGSLLSEGSPRSAQWLTAHIDGFVKTRLGSKSPGDADIERSRLYRNLLSSMPMCFNIFGQFAAYPNAAALALGPLVGVEISRITEIRVEHAPQEARAALGDRTAFDAFVRYRTPVGPGFLAIETKYTEAFSPTEYPVTDAYRAATDDPAGWFVPGSGPAAHGAATNQLWRNTMLAQLTEQLGAEAGRGRVVVLTATGDSTAEAAVAGLRPLLKDPDERMRHVLLEDLVSACAKVPDLRSWAALFAARYLDQIR